MIHLCQNPVRSAFILYSLLFLISCSTSKTEAEKEEEGEWIQLFNGKDLNDWTIKIAKHELNENFANTFRVEDSLMKVRYDGYEAFDQQYGHIYFNTPFSYYLLNVEYRFVGEQAPGGEGWALRNSGAMLHCQDPKTILIDQDFPISIEGQFLGGDGTNERTTSNLCTPGTNVYMDGELFTPHCVNSSSKTYHGEQWVTAQFLVLGDSVVYHILEGDTVLKYFHPEIGGGNVSPSDPAVKVDGTPLKSGFIALQSESHPIDFRKVELFDLAAYKGDKEKLKEVMRRLSKKE
ncbi:3-keto-disaccharide hydrolase [Aquiflexum gelatinilyticum]|uniref:3-keto-disaccharide hydrolase n=1 Tax=Aquiflexum gelatinilyticum TaxID=2961943 RepID=UPI002166FF70|nr:DUF1080 domain-containing protein [Aquiflexum gelatinilyticum]MCS4436674.1 DUF1080 domain-containing protein [Aquiflexum gelatinilyticum]